MIIILKEDYFDKSLKMFLFLFVLGTEIVSGLVTNVASMLWKWLWSLQTSTTTTATTKSGKTTSKKFVCTLLYDLTVKVSKFQLP